MKAIKIGITGSGGFIGGYIKKALEKMASVDVDCCNRRELFNRNSGKLAKFVRNKDVVIHAAAATRGDDFSLITGNIIATYNLISAVKRHGKKTKIIFLSSSAVDAQKITVYGESKKLTELMLEDFSRIYKIPVTIFRLTNVFGKGAPPFHNSVVATFCYQTVRRKRLEINRKGDPVMLIHVEDAVRTIIPEVFRKRRRLFYFRRVYSNNIIAIPKIARLIRSFKNLKSSPKLTSKFRRDLYKTYLWYAGQARNH